MPLVSTNRNINGVVIGDAVFRPEILTASGAQTWPEGSVLGRVTSSGKYVRYNPGASDGSEVPSAILTEEHVFAASGDKSIRVAVLGQFRMGRLVNNTNTAISAADAFALRTYGLIAQPVNETTIQDNQ